ncbi:MAG: acyl-CoA desaturase [Cyanothece sp. SIO2G6]|nr:acyl-CoA desaturase [Cyanothece sp. SIO2G6]
MTFIDKSQPLSDVKSPNRKPVPESDRKPKIVLDNPYLKQMQQRFAYVTILTPTVGTIVAIALLPILGMDLLTLGLFISFYLLTIVGIEVGYHRYFSHNSFRAHPAVKIALAICGSMAAQGPVIHWVSNHRRHHQYSDQPDDPHSPHLHPPATNLSEWIKSIWHGHIGWMFTSDVTNATLYSRDWLRDPLIARINQLYTVWIIVGLLLPSLIGGLVSMSWTGALQGFLWGGLVRIFGVHHAIWGVNSICHLWGAQPFKTKECSRNVGWLSLVTVGGSWHNNHHAFPNAAILQFYWWQVDLGGWLIHLLKRVGLVSSIKAPSADLLAAKTVLKTDSQ